MQVNETVSVVEYDPSWPLCYRREAEKIQKAISGGGFSIEHIGSTSVNGMWAKPIIDILVGTESFPPEDSFIAEIVSAGYTYQKDASVADRLYFVKRTVPHSNLHVVQYNGTIWKMDLAFREFLRHNPDAAAEYSQLKRQIAESGTTALLEYSAKKAPLIERFLQKILELK